jgi:PAS domain S-box-containing protein
MFEQSPDGILIIDPETKRFLEFNTVAHQQLGYSREEFAQLCINDVEATETVEETTTRVASVMRDGKADFETLQRTRNGEIRNIHVTAQLLDFQGYPGYHCVWRDITERKRAESASRENEARMRAITDSVKEAIIIIDQKGLVSYWNPAAVRLFGYTSDEVTGKNLHTLLTPQRYHQAFDTAFTHYQLTGQGKALDATLELQARHKNGHEIFVELSLTALPEQNGWDTIGIIRDITERKKSQEALRESEERYRAIHDASFGGIVIHDQGIILDCNRGLSDLTGYSREELIGMDGLRLIAPDWRDVVRQHIQQRFEQAYDVEGLRKDGTIYPLYIRGTTIPYKGRMVRVTEFRDITERKNAEQALRESEAAVRKKLQIILEPEGNIGTLELADIIDAPALQTMMEHFNRITKLVFAIVDNRGQVLVSAGWQDICTKFHRVHPVTLKNCNESDTLLTNGVPEGTFKAYHCNNNLWDIATPIVIGDKRVGNVFLGQFFYDNDIIDYELFRSQAKKYGFDEKEYLAALDRVPRLSHDTAEATMAFYSSLSKMISSLSYSTIKLARTLSQKDSALHQLDESKAFQASLLEAIPIPVFYKDIDGRYLGCNKAFEDFYGQSKELLIGKGVFDMYPPELAKIYHAKDAELLAKQGSQVYESMIQDTHGTRHNVIFHKASLINSQGVNIGLIGAIIDITERKRAEEEKDKLESQLQQAQKLESVALLAGGVAHDFNNMLGVIIGHAEMAMHKVHPDQPLLADLKKIHNAAERSAEITRQLLTFARKQNVAPKVLDLNKTTEGMLKMLRRLIGENIILSWKPGVNLWPVKVDPSQIDQILANLCVNARDAIAGVGQITVETKNSTFDKDYYAIHADIIPGEYVRLTVSDSGCGMEKQTLAHIFEPFFTTKGIGVGTGLGLATVYGAVKQNNGYINVYSEPGQGTTFTVYLPKYLGYTGQSRVEDTTRPAVRGHETILLVEDELTILEMTQIMLQQLGYTVLAASTPSKAIKLASESIGEIHLLLTDIIMPEMNGRNLSERLLASKPGMASLFMSGYTADIIAHQGVLDEGVNFIQKPFSQKELASKVRAALDSKIKNAD